MISDGILPVKEEATCLGESSEGLLDMVSYSVLRICFCLVWPRLLGESGEAYPELKDKKEYILKSCSNRRRDLMRL